MAVRSEARKCVESFKTEYADTLCRVGEVMLAFSSGILTVVTFGTSFWLQSSPSPELSTKTAPFHSGLWQNCSSTDNGCTTLPLAVPGYIIAARFFMCVALMAGMCTWIISIVGLLQHKPIWLFLATGGYFTQTITMILGLASFGRGFSYSTDEVKLRPAWSYNVGWLATVLAFLCGIYFLSVAVYRRRNPASTNYPGQTRSYAPLAQFESTETGSDDDDDL